jgi:hypothetical protein
MSGYGMLAEGGSPTCRSKAPTSTSVLVALRIVPLALNDQLAFGAKRTSGAGKPRSLDRKLPKAKSVNL